MTRDRLASLVGCMESYLGNCQHHARSPEFVVADDSRSADAADSTRVALGRLADRFNLQVRYAGRQEKSRFATAVAAESAVSLDIIRFAIFGDDRCTLSTGANRNSLLLDAAGELMLTVDDDTLCRVAEPPGRETALSFFSGYDPTEFWFFPDRSRATQSISFVDVDFLGCHDALLGNTVADLQGPAETRGSVTMTLYGLVGDSGMASPRYYLTLGGASRDRLVASPQVYQSALRSREILRRVRQPTVTAGPFCMTTFLGIDNRRLLPPFFPVERNSDGIFGQMLRKCVDGSHVAFLPWVLLHAPEPARSFSPDDLWSEAKTVRLADIIIACVLGHETQSQAVATAARLVDLGRHLQWLGSLPLSDFEEYVGSVQNLRDFAVVTALHGQIQTFGASPGFWADDVSHMIELISNASAAEDYVFPRDLCRGRDVYAGRRLAQELVRKFGELLESWPAMVGAAQRLRGAGCRLAAAV